MRGIVKSGPHRRTTFSKINFELSRICVFFDLQYKCKNRSRHCENPSNICHSTRPFDRFPWLEGLPEKFTNSFHCPVGCRTGILVEFEKASEGSSFWRKRVPDQKFTQLGRYIRCFLEVFHCFRRNRCLLNSMNEARKQLFRKLTVGNITNAVI